MFFSILENYAKEIHTFSAIIASLELPYIEAPKTIRTFVFPNNTCFFYGGLKHWSGSTFFKRSYKSRDYLR